jgi:ribosomal protein S27AE
MAKSTHIHKLKRLKYKSGNTIFFCSLPDCTFKTNIALALGKRSLCWRCGESFIMSEYALRLAKPHCDQCHKPKSGVSEEDVRPTILVDSTEPIIQIPFHNQTASTGLWEPAEPSLAEKMQMEIHKAQEKEEEI